ncbi:MULTISPECIES: amino acid ABC transporter permease [unclassified Pseudomonas]|jgi:His/Glu/Gln/Arg/opine family amino acid ABC transporter permease subunit|uniref:amino acid ABC transporter permease n=2 Tax=Pseudomonas TaxID=286 RepID=UPI0007C672B4|nr:MULTISPECIES: amino acid ABC transporter permease [unclassified Pseudomonas]GLO46721.1 amino acid ABC transporter [Pseudomonas putida]HDS0980423.1 amino acid ABC transporter permease [Pseudomonas putida]
MISFFQQYPEYWSDWSVRLMLGARVTAELSLLGFALAVVLGALLVWAMRSPSAILRRLAAFFIQSMRAVPLLALLLALYFALPSLGLTLSGYWAGAIGLGLQGAAYVAEILRGGLDSLHRGQREAAIAIGLTPFKAFTTVILPQVFRVILPPLLNAYVSILKDSSLCALIATDELMLAARAIASETFLPMHVFLLVGLFYFVIAFPLSMLSRVLEKHVSRGRKTVRG